MMTTLKNLISYLTSIQVHYDGDINAITINDVSDDNRKLTDASLFVAVIGKSVDGHRFIPSAIDNGAVAIMGMHSPAQLAEMDIHLPETIPYIQVSDSRSSLATCCAALQGFPSEKLTVVGITGTDGKTTTCEILTSIFNVATANKVGTISTVGAIICGQRLDTGLHVTTPVATDVQRFLRQMSDASCEYSIVESTSHALNQARLDAVNFDIAAVTNITHEHIDEHGSRDAYVDAKANLFRKLFTEPRKANTPRYAVLNGDDVGSLDALSTVLANMRAKTGRAIPERVYSMDKMPVAAPSRDADVYASQIVHDAGYTQFQLHWWGGEFTVRTKLIGGFNIANILCASTISLSLGIHPDHISIGVEHMEGVLGRMERMDAGQPFLTIVDFAHSPASLERALETLRVLIKPNSTGRLISVFGSAGLRDHAKRGLMGQVSGRLADYTIITAEDPRTEDLNLINAAIAYGVQQFVSDDAFTIVRDRAEAIQTAIDMAQPYDIIGIFGKGHERSMCFGEIEYPWSDQQVTLDALAKAGYHPP
ncbi:MAG: UDP-N-acetylmuramoyl-L-alanyl-D-glutamate--2,6-diaminopimelate ligase [Chloroflexota bacterium]